MRKPPYAPPDPRMENLIAAVGGVRLRSMAHPRGVWWRRLLWLFRPHRLNAASLETVWIDDDELRRPGRRREGRP